jgi:hypothetical protein
MPSRLDAPSSQHRSTLKTSYDVKMATRQPQIDSLPPTDKAEQEKWAQAQLQQHSTCAAGLPWRKIPGGYQCTGPYHIMTHKLLAEGKGGVYFDLGMTTRSCWVGQLYGQEIVDIMVGILSRQRMRELMARRHDPSGGSSRSSRR